MRLSLSTSYSFNFYIEVWRPALGEIFLKKKRNFNGAQKRKSRKLPLFALLTRVSNVASINKRGRGVLLGRSAVKMSIIPLLRLGGRVGI